MNYFQQYETERKYLKVGKMWICDDPVAISQNSDSLGEIIEIIEIDEIEEHFYCRFLVLSGKYRGARYLRLRTVFTKGYKPYTGARPFEDEEVTND
jgi:hypothetical protein